MARRSILSHALLLCALLRASTCAHQLLLVSCDGFRYDYLDWYPNETQFLRQLIPRGVHVKRMTPAFATKTFPNHWTIATGLYQESHGIVSNSMYDPQFDAWFNKSNHEERWWNASLPVWITARKQGLTSATFFWPGSEVQFEGIRQNHYYEYNESYPFDFRVKTALEWITEERIDLTVIYFEQPDSSGHRFGPNSTEVRAALGKVNAAIKSLFDGLQEKNFSDKVNVLIVSDHGMAELSTKRVVNFTNSIDQYVEKYLDSGTLFGVNPKPGREQELLQFLEKEASRMQQQVRVYSKDSLPERFRYSKHRRIPQVLVLPPPGYVVVSSRDTKPVSLGNHGFDNEYSDMSIPMFAVGPSFRKNVVVDGFRQIDIYGLVCHLLGLRPQPNNGSLELLPKMLNGVARASQNPWTAGLGAAAALLLPALVSASGSDRGQRQATFPGP